MTTCKTCLHWAPIGRGEGECVGMDMPENIVRLFVYHRYDDGIWVAIDDAIDDPPYKAGMITDASFGCKLWEDING